MYCVACYRYDSEDNKLLVRVLLDSDSQCHFITKEACKLLGIRLQDSERTIVKGFEKIEKVINSNPMNLEIHSRYNNNIKYSIAPLIVDQITDALPRAVVGTSVLSHLRNLPLADETFGTPNKIDILIGTPHFAHLLLHDDVTSAPQASRTVLGYVIMGSVPTLFSLQALTCCLSAGAVHVS